MLQQSLIISLLLSLLYDQPLPSNAIFLHFISFHHRHHHIIIPSYHHIITVKGEDYSHDTIIIKNDAHQL
jgi:hypothetical protein